MKGLRISPLYDIRARASLKHVFFCRNGMWGNADEGVGTSVIQDIGEDMIAEGTYWRRGINIYLVIIIGSGTSAMGSYEFSCIGSGKDESWMDKGKESLDMQKKILSMCLSYRRFHPAFIVGWLFMLTKG